MRFMNSIVGLSPKNAEIGGVAPIASPAVSVKISPGASARYASKYGFRNADPPIANVGFAAPVPPTLSAASASGTSCPWKSEMFRTWNS